MFVGPQQQQNIALLQQDRHYQHQHQHRHPAVAGANLDLELDLDLDLDLDIDLDADNLSSHSLSSSANSTESLVSRFPAAAAAPLSAFDSIPPIAVPRRGGALPEAPLSLLDLGHDASMLSAAVLMHPSDAGLPSNGQFTLRSGGRMSHHRESSLSSLGSAGPASPFSQNTSNPHIAVTDSVGDVYHGMPFFDDSSYHLSKSLTGGPNHDAFYTNHSAYAPDSAAPPAYASMLAANSNSKSRPNRGLLPPPELSIASSTSRPVSVASSVGGDSPATPSLEQPEDERRRRNVFSHAVPKLDRTMTDIYSDELYSPDFSLTSASPSQATSQLAVSPSHDMFAQRLQAINSQHLNAAHSPVSSSRGDRSPFRHGSPLAPAAASHEFAPNVAHSTQMRFGSAQQLRERRQAEQDAQVLQQQMARNADASTPQTISPKDAILEFHDADGGASFPLFPQPGPASTAFEAGQMGKAAAAAAAAAAVTTASQPYTTAVSLGGPGFDYLAQQLPHGLHVPQQYPFIAQPRQQSSSASLSVPSRGSSAGTNSTESSGSSALSRPAATSADGGTYTCTYHGCTLRFDTPVLLQKHKREGHRHGHGLGTGARRADAMSGVTAPGPVVDSQAGPHRCERINPSTGKPCNTVFSRPYDLTRHEDTIHNARKQKVRCSLCTEEKTFSRADALTRHFRVCHPDVEFAGKHRKRGGHGA